MNTASAAKRMREKFSTLNPGDQLRVAYPDQRRIYTAGHQAGKHLSVFKTAETAFSDRFLRHVPVWLVTVL